MRKRLHQIQLFLLTATVICSMSQTAGAQEETDDPWWAKDYETQTRTVTSYSYDKDGNVTLQEASAEGSQLQFIEREFISPESLSSSDKPIYETIVKTKQKKPGVSDTELIKQLKKSFKVVPFEDLTNIFGLYEFENNSGYYSYLNKTPEEKDIQVFDSWFDTLSERFPDAPNTLEELQDIEAKVLADLSKKFNLSPSVIEDTIYRMEKYQQKYSLPANVKLSEALKKKTG